MIKPSTVRIDDASFPRRLREKLGSDAPQYLDFLGNLGLLRLIKVGFCGSRKATAEGIAAAQECARQVTAHGICVVSGNASGVDLAAHRAALEAGGSTIFVLPEGIERFRIRSDLRTVWDWSRCLVLSQWPSKSIWKNYQAMRRNNTIIGLSNAMVVVEAGRTGGTKHAGENSIYYNTPLFVLEFREYLEEREGNRELIRMGGIGLKRTRETRLPSLARVIEAAKRNAADGPAQTELEF